MGRDRIEDDGYGGRFRRSLHRREQLAESLGTYALPIMLEETIDPGTNETAALHGLDLTEEDLAGHAEYLARGAAAGDSPGVNVT